MMNRERISVEIEGIVQGVGFRPFVYRLARLYQLTGWVSNTSRGVLLEAEGKRAELDAFYLGLQNETPPLAVITSISRNSLLPVGSEDFAILASSGGEGGVQISPDCDVCPDCLAELFDPHDRRHRYPFINCTNCGPRYSIITATPYDRESTTMAAFAMCDTCLAEYADPANRRFHAQPNACPVCGPTLRLLYPDGGEVSGDPLEEAVRLLKEGRIVAVKGIGGYHLAVDAGNETAVAELRKRKKRDEKPFALMVAGLEQVSRIARADATEERLLVGPERPIVLLGKRDGNPIARLVAPANGYFGLMLPSTPLQHLLLRDNFTALVMTSGNVSDEPIVYRDPDALAQLSGIADYFLLHDREIHARNDDSVIRVFRGAPLFLRRSRGYVPRGVTLRAAQREVLAVGAELKGAICLTRGDRAFMSQHIGDLKNVATFSALEETVSHLERVLSVTPELLAHDLHPDYLSTSYALGRSGLPRLAVQHHHAHMASCMAENGLDDNVIGVIFDGTGFGPDGTIWGGEFLLGDYSGFERRGHLAPVPMPGGDAAVRETWRMALSHCHRAFGAEALTLPLPFLSPLSAQEKSLLQRMLERGINSPLTSSCGRLFDAVAALIGVRERVSFEGQAAIELEAAAEKGGAKRCYPYAIIARDNRLVVDFRLMFAALLLDLAAGVAQSEMARSFHETLTNATADVCAKIGKESGVNRVVLSGGVFQNKLLAEGVHNLLTENGFQVFSHRLVPPNDGGLALGQAAIAGRSLICV